MSTYVELKEQAEKLLAEAEEARKKEVAAVIADIHKQMAKYGLTMQDINKGFTPDKSRKSASVIKYRGPQGQTWVGGRGRKPDWILAHIKAGKNIKDFEV